MSGLRSLRLFTVLIVLTLLITAAGQPAAAVATPEFTRPPDLSRPPDSPATNQIIIKYRDHEPASPAGENQRRHLSQAAGLELAYQRAMAGGAHVMRLPGHMPAAQVEAITARLMALPEVEYAHADQVRFHTLTPNDFYYAFDQWDLSAPITGRYGINAPTAWDITTGGASVVVAVVDTGILLNHPDLAGRTVPGYDFISIDTVGNDANPGRDSDPSDPGDWVASSDLSTSPFNNWDCPIYSSSWHGSHVAGTIGASSNNAEGIAGINWNSKILPVRVLGKCGGTDSDIIDGVYWAAGLAVPGVPLNPNPARVINLSLGGYGQCDLAWQAAANAVTAAGASIVVAAGNKAKPASTFTPGNCNNVINVAASNKAGSRASYSNHDWAEYPKVVDISAPGGDGLGYIRSASNTGRNGPETNNYSYKMGTSMAAPHVAGVVSLLYSLKPDLTPQQVLAALQNSATPFPAVGSCSTSNCGAGILNAAQAVLAVIPPVAFNKGLPASGATGQPTSLTLTWGTSSGVAGYQYCFDTINNATCDGTWTGAFQPSASISGLANGTTYYWHVQAVNHNGTTDSDGGAWWSFTTQVAPPVAFKKTGPSDGQGGQVRTLTLTWAESSGAESYEYCVDTTDDSACDTPWATTKKTSVGIGPLTFGATYYWHVRAANPGGKTPADSDIWWRFTVMPEPVYTDFTYLSLITR